MRLTANAVEAAAALEAKASAARRSGDDSEGAPANPPPAPTVVRPDVFSYSAAITACGNCGEWRRALALLRVMRTQGVPPNVRLLCVCTFRMSAFGRDGVFCLMLRGP